METPLPLCHVLCSTACRLTPSTGVCHSKIHVSCCDVTGLMDRERKRPGSKAAQSCSASPMCAKRLSWSPTFAHIICLRRSTCYIQLARSLSSPVPVPPFATRIEQSRPAQYQCKHRSVCRQSPETRSSKAPSWKITTTNTASKHRVCRLQAAQIALKVLEEPVVKEAAQ